MFARSHDSREVVFGKQFSEPREDRRSEDDQRIPQFLHFQVDYKHPKASSHYVVVHFMLECCKKLEAKCLTTATACSLFHKFFSKADITKYDPYLIAAASIYLAGKVEDDQLRLRDVINVVHSTLHRSLTPLPLGDEYWNMRDAIVQAELFVLRMVEFRVRTVHPHKYLLHYLTTIRDWLQHDAWIQAPIPTTAWAVLQDLYHDPFVVTGDPSVMALGVLQLTLDIYGIQMPLLNGIESEMPWFRLLNSMATKERIWEVMTRCSQVYTKEKEFLEPICIDVNKLTDPASSDDIVIE